MIYINICLRTYISKTSIYIYIYYIIKKMIGAACYYTGQICLIAK